MILFGDRVVCSTGDLVAAARCEFALLRALDAELGLVTPIELPSTGALTHASDMSVEHRLADLRDRYGSGVVRVRIPGTSDPAESTAALHAAHEQTLTALRANADAVAGAVVFDGSFAAQCDFLLHDSDPETHDYLPAAVATPRTAVTALLTLAACADALRHNGFRPAPQARLWLDGIATTHSLADIAVVYHARRARLNLILDAKLGELLPVQWGDRRFLACGRCPACTFELESRRDLALVAGMRPATRAQLRDAGITTVERLAAADATVTRVPAPTFTTLRRQAELQIHRETTGTPAHTLIDAAALAALPTPTPRDLFISVRIPDLPIDPLSGRLTDAIGDLIVAIRAATPGTDATPLAPAGRTRFAPAARSPLALTPETVMAPGSESPLASVGDIPLDSAEETSPTSGAAPGQTGATVLDPTAGTAGELDEEMTFGPGDDLGGDAVRTFIIRAGHRAERDEKAGRQGGSQDDADALLEFLAQRQREFSELRIHHYRGNLRAVLSALGERYSEGEDLVAELLPALVDLYPVVRAALIVGERSYDLHQLPPNQGEADDGPEAVLRLRDWLLDVAAEHEVRPARRWAYDYAETGSDEIEAALREFADAGRVDRSMAQTAAAYTAAALGYHRRERQPQRWAHDDRLDHPVEEWADTPGVLLADWGTVDTKWHSTGQRPMRRYLTLTGRLGTGNAPKPGTHVLTLYDRPAPGMTALPGRRATAHATVLGCSLDANFEDVVRVVEQLPAGCEPYDELPTAIAPRPPGREVFLEEALEDIAHGLLITLPQVPETAVFDLLCRRPPRLRTGEALPEVFGDHAAAVTAAVLDLDNSYVAVQGPPGTGKTDTTARVLERLVTRYKWRVGVVARSHAVVEHVLDAVVEVGVLPELVAKADAQSVASEWLPIDASRYPRFLDNAVNGCVVGGLPGDFADDERISRAGLDLLVIVDAGKFPLAEAVAVAVCARNLLLVGDPAPAAAHGAHPEPIAESALGRLVGANRTLPAAHGYFLDRTWRMHPRMSGPVSRLRYENRLRSNETVTLARELDGVPPGVRTVSVEHHGNSTESAEEAREIVRQVRTLLGLPWHTGAVTRRLHPHDILVVAPYHAQVARIRTLLSRARIEDVLVGTPDHFQGREAAVVLVSMTTSAPADAPHGIAALLSRHWLTSAISRAMWSAVIVRSPLLTEYLPATTAELSDLAATLQLDRV
ncbi:AAA domain-containing protein [Nocardia sp. NPDC051030]|uniref:bifunctional RecB family nuclease/DEAD/DEAH box helicase n=1 Tax=Nocardia sp. NPDC051030 TaxID=3155162 RepID=UPI003435F6D5